MPYKDKETKKKHDRDDKRKKRGTTAGGDKTGTTVPASFVHGITGDFEALPERPRFLTLSDGQVLDRLNSPEGHASGDFILRMRYCNESSYNFMPNAIKHKR